MNPTPTEVAAALARLLERHPNWRAGQAVANAAVWARGAEVSGVWEMEDAEFIAAVDAHLAARPANAREPVSASAD